MQTNASGVNRPLMVSMGPLNPLFFHYSTHTEAIDCVRRARKSCLYAGRSLDKNASEILAEKQISDSAAYKKTRGYVLNIYVRQLLIHRSFTRSTAAAIFRQTFLV